MKFLMSQKLERSPLLKNLVGAVVIFIIFFLALDTLLHAIQIGMTPHQVSLTLLGDSENFEEPMLFDALLLQIHIDLFMSLFAILILSTVAIRLSGEQRYEKWTLHILFIFGLLSPLTLLLSYLIPLGGVFVFAWMGTFAIWHILALIQSAKILMRLYLS